MPTVITISLSTAASEVSLSDQIDCTSDSLRWISASVHVDDFVTLSPGACVWVMMNKETQIVAKALTKVLILLVFKISSDCLCDFEVVYTRDCREVTHYIEMVWLFKEGKEVTRRSISCLINLRNANCHGDSTVAATSIGYTKAIVINTSF
ncbi:hypothetical protein LOK49_LG01G03923 [Camellia lanceoleosa]|uniref:Uncharacterized protein n=1 Tax=Camellia lanceoleosa TaxID=1840588 RepID=A0ACC0IX59_9ERIC|nr:hypothetical protein LOK49_LG01G03923 [Camellia lanceoleosa]